jgi:L-malate glycosyltransferase
MVYLHEEISEGKVVGASLPDLAYVVNSLNPGGTEKLVVEMSLAFSAEFQVTVLCLDEPGLWANRLRSNGIPVHSLWRQPGLDLSIPVKLARHFRRHRTRIVHAHQCTPWFYSALSRMLSPAPRLLFEEHGRFYPEIENRKRAFINWVLVRQLTHRFVAVSDDVRKRLQEYEGLDYDRIEVVYNGVDSESTLTEDERKGLRKSFGVGPHEFVVGTVGRFDPIKNFPMLVKSLAEANGGAPSIKGILVGDGPIFGEIKAQVEELGLSNRVTMTGHRENARKLVQCMDLFVLPSFSEGTSMALLEAIAAGVPVAVTDVGGNPEIVIKDETGWVIPSDSGGCLTAAILEAVSDSEKRRKFAQAGRLRHVEHFTFDKMIENYRRIYGEMLDDRSQSTRCKAHATRERVSFETA